MKSQEPKGEKRRVWRSIGGSAVGIVAFAALVAGGLALWVNTSQRDDAGYFSAEAHRYQTSTRAIVSEKITLGGSYCDGECDLPSWLIGKVRLEAFSAKRVFVGIAPAADAEEYLSGVAHATATDLDLDPFRVTYDTHGGATDPGRPADQSFWAASATGSGTSSVTWKPKAGDWSIVVMNTDGSPGVSAEIAAGAKAPWLIWVGIAGASIGGILLAAALLLLGGGRRPGGQQTAGTSVPAL